ncbi:MAG TPA: hypothetical protein VKZ53_20355 [Candidatus Angelobacter sp.]|nr:hypothetical protein [Candidatus Angelobacter sp.]
MLKKIRVILLFAVVGTALAHAQSARNIQPTANQSPIPDNRELMLRAKSFYVHSDTFFMKREELESSLLGRKEFKDWDLQITNKMQQADLLVRVRRIPFTNHFTYTVTDRLTETIALAGTVDSLAGTVHGLIADEIIHKMKVMRATPPAAPTATTSPQTVAPKVAQIL